MKTAAIYARVSTAEQVKGTSLDGQVETCKAFAAQHGYTVVKEVSEDITGTRLDRPGLDSIRDMVLRGELAAIIVWDVDRLSRDAANFYILNNEFERHNVQLLFVNTPNDSSPAGQMFLGMRAVFAQFERVTITDRLRRGKDRRLREGQIMGSRLMPYGYTCVKGLHQLIPVEEQLYWVPRMYDWLVKERCSLAEIARRLSDNGAPTREGGKHWQRGSVHSILTNSVYAGEWCWNKVMPTPDKKRSKLKPQDEWIKVDVNPIISWDIYEAARKQLELNMQLKAAASKKHKTPFLLRSMAFCEHCGRRLFAKTIKVHRFYGCPTRHGDASFRHLPPKERCITGFVHADKLETAVWAKLLETISSREKMEAILAGRDETLNEERRRWDDELASLLKTQEGYTNEEDAILRAFRKGIITETKLEGQMAEIRDQQVAIERALEHVQERIASHQAATATLESLQELCDLAERGLPNLTFDEKRTFLHNINAAVRVKGHKATITGLINIPAFDFIAEHANCYNVNAVKVAHHGSDTSSTPQFLAQVHPQVAIISVGTGNRFGHPSGQTVQALEDAGAKIYRTDLNGTVEVIADTERLWVRSER